MRLTVNFYKNAHVIIINPSLIIKTAVCWGMSDWLTFVEQSINLRRTIGSLVSSDGKKCLFAPPFLLFLVAIPTF